MTVEHCVGFLCLVPLDASGPRFFGFSEYIAGLALMVLAWTIGDVRYRFRVRTAPLPLQGITFAVVAILGILTLLTDLWRAEQWLVPRGHVLTPSGWQALLGVLFLLTFLTWAWFAFIRPPRYGKWNAKRYAQTLYGAIVKGSPSELSVIADEFRFSAKSLVSYATDRGEFKDDPRQDGEASEPATRAPGVTAYADDVLLLIADKRFCRAIVESSPGTALAVFHEIGKAKKYGIQVEVFAKNVVAEALANKDSFLFHETEGYQSGFIGYHKPLSQAMFANYPMVEAIGTLLEPDIWKKDKWDAAQWQAYCRMVLITFRDYVKHGGGEHSYVLYRAKGYIEHAASDLYKINGLSSDAWDSDARERLQVVVEFVQKAIEILDAKEVPQHLQLRIRDKGARRGFYDYLAEMIFEIIFYASRVKSPAELCWFIQHNSVWGELFNFDRSAGVAGKVVKFKVRRLIYKEVTDMRRFPNFKGATILGFCLNVMGFSVRSEGSFGDSRALQKAILAWTKKNYAWLHSYNSRIAEACLVDGITYEAENLRLVKTYPAKGLRREAAYSYLDVEPQLPDHERLVE